MITMLLISATLLGLLAFFEPCTIATHTLFSVRVNRSADGKAGWQRLLVVWLSRTALLTALFMLVVAVTDPPQWGPFAPSIILSAMAVLYMVSRFVYIPVPHLAFYRLLPGGSRLSFATQLGLTLPACTLPLVIVTAGMAMTLDSVLFAALAGFLFATWFSLPMVFASRKGIHDDGRQLLNKAARGSPWLTAALLLGTALYLLVPALNIAPAAFRETLQTASWAGIGVAFVAGFVFSFNPVSFASIPVMLAYVTKAHEERRALWMGAAFVVGMVATHVVLGVTVALGGEWIKAVMGRQWGVLLGPVLIIMGLVWPGWLNIRLPWFGIRARRVSGYWGAFLLGIPFSVAICPFCAPALMVALTASAAIGSAGFGAALLFAFALGRSIPIILGAWGMGWLESLRILSRYQKPFEVIGGVVLVLSGLYLLNSYFFLVRF